MKTREQLIDKYLSKYSEHHCILLEKKRTLFHYVWMLQDKEDIFMVYVGKTLYLDVNIGQRLTVGKIGKRLINIRRGYCKMDSNL